MSQRTERAARRSYLLGISFGGRVLLLLKNLRYAGIALRDGYKPSHNANFIAKNEPPAAAHSTFNKARSPLLPRSTSIISVMITGL